jgi:hypothetical protein
VKSDHPEKATSLGYDFEEDTVYMYERRGYRPVFIKDPGLENNLKRWNSLIFPVIFLGLPQ